jgi:hypothetical protein
MVITALIYCFITFKVLLWSFICNLVDMSFGCSSFPPPCFIMVLWIMDIDLYNVSIKSCMVLYCTYAQQTLQTMGTDSSNVVWPPLPVLYAWEL